MSAGTDMISDIPVMETFACFGISVGMYKACGTEFFVYLICGTTGKIFCMGI
jgi:hypothetical protein